MTPISPPRRLRSPNRVALFAFTLLAFAAGAAEYEIQPKTVERGAGRTIRISVTPCDANSKLPADASLASAAPGITVTSVLVQAATQCELTATLTVEERAAFGKVFVNLLGGADGSKSLLKALEIEVVALTPEPTPPGLGQKVDIMWKVLPDRPVSDSFGRKVADQYFAVELMIGNNSGYALLVENIGFLAKRMPATGTPWPNDSYAIVRSTIEREQQVGSRALILNSITGAAGLASGMSGFFVNDRHLAQFGVFLGLANPLVEGFRLVWPDKTVRQLVALDTRVFRGSMIIKNGDTKSVLTFISREMVECKRNCVVMKGGRIPFSGRGFNPVQIIEELGQVVLVGHEIDYINRVRVVSRETPTPPAVPPVVSELPLASRTITQGGTIKLDLTGNGLANIAPAVPDSSGLSASRTTNDSNGKFSEVTVTAGLDAKPGTVTMSASTAGGSTQLQLLVVAGTPKVNTVTPATKAAKIGTPTTMTLTGEFLNRVKVTAPSGITVEPQQADDEDGRLGKKLVIKVTPAAGTATGNARLVLTRDNKSANLEINIVP